MIEDQKQALTELLTRALSVCGLAQEPIRLERPKQADHGDLASTIALQCAKKAGKNPRELAASLVGAMKRDEAFSNILSDAEIAGPGFINFRFSQEAKVRPVRDVLREGADYGKSKAFEGKSVLLEYVSANPTGPLHLGHARQGALGDVLSRVMRNDVPAVLSTANTVLCRVDTFATTLNSLPLQNTVASVNSIAGNLELTTARLNGTDNTLGLLLNDRYLYDRLTGTVGSLDSLLIDLRLHPKRYLHFSVF